MSDLVHTRTLRMTAHRVGERELDVTGHLVDERPQSETWNGVEQGRVIHDMALTLRVRHPDLVVTAVSATMDARPYTLCTDALDPLQALVGLSVAHGFTREVNERFGRARGCAHLTALIHALAPVVRQAMGAAFTDGDREAPGRDADLWFVDTCQAWRRDGPLHTRVVANDAEGLRALSARTPPPR